MDHAVGGRYGRNNFRVVDRHLITVDVDEDDTDLPLYSATTEDPYVLTLAPNQIYTNADFGFGPFGKIGDFVWYDKDGDGVYDPGEKGMGGILITASNTGIFEVLFQLTTVETRDPPGNYLFQSRSTNQYFIEMIIPAGYVISTDNYPMFTNAGPGEYVTNADFGLTGCGVGQLG